MKVDLLAFSGGLHKYIKETAYLFSLWNILNEKVKKQKYTQKIKKSKSVVSSLG